MSSGKEESSVIEEGAVVDPQERERVGVERALT
jgi:hypothetical protein